MFKKITVISSIALLAVATPMPLPQAISQCNTGSMQCCNSVQNVSSTALGELAGMLGINLNLQGLTIPVGLTCSGISVSDHAFMAS